MHVALLFVRGETSLYTGLFLKWSKRNLTIFTFEHCLELLDLRNKHAYFSSLIHNERKRENNESTLRETKKCRSVNKSN